jgi:outer membrane protein OmpA-like peptidoglycan-associated protein/nitrous oxidase accessory protein NosD
MKLLLLKNQLNLTNLYQINTTHLPCPVRKVGIMGIILLSVFSQTNLALAQSQPSAWKVIVNSNQDGEITPDGELTLREAISLVNGSLRVEQLSDREKTQVEALTGNSSRIEFNLPPQQTTIALQEQLPPLTSPGLTIDGTTQPGYDASTSPTAEIKIPQPVVSLTVAANAEVLRGLTVLANNITIRGLSIYGFTSTHADTASTPPADIFIAPNFIPPITKALTPLVGTLPQLENLNPTENVVIEDNWLGIMPDETVPPVTSAFGVSVFNAVGTTIRRNRISYHDGSAIITGLRAERMQIAENIILGNGIAGMPDAIRLDGKIHQSEIRSNLICANDGSGVFVFRPEGAVRIWQNQIKFNGRRLRRAAVYLMGNDNQVEDNDITYQSGAGVVVTSYPQSDRNQIINNRFSNLEGLSIDLNTQHNVGVQDFQNGDGPNPQRNSPNRRLDTANAGINTPKFLSHEFFWRENGVVGIDGLADPNSQIDIYRVSGNADSYGFLQKRIGTATTNAQGKFSLNLSNLQPGDRISAIATLPQYGTSEPTYPSFIRSLNTSLPQTNSPVQIAQSFPQCVTKPVAETPPPPPPPPNVPPAPIILKVPKNIHFALDKDNISPASGKILDAIAQVLRDNPSIIIEIQGHTDRRASNAYNLKLAARRAKSTRNYLIRRGIAPERMTIRSFGESQLLTDGISKLDHARNRRVEINFQDFRGIEVIVQEQDLQLE